MRKCMGCMEDYDEKYMICPFCGYAENSDPEEANQLRPGTILHNKYVVGKAIGHGGFGVTYLGFDAELERKVAIKEYMPNEFSNRIPGNNQVIVYEGDKREQFDSGLMKFTEEARRLAMFQDKEGIVQIYDCFLENNTAYLVMEYLDGITVKEKIKRDGKMGLEEALGIIMPILRSLKEVNAAGILHRDIAPDNIMLTSAGEAKLIDFGASRFATTGHSRSLTVLIKQGFAPVEQYNSRGDQGTWTDVYGLAATFYFLLTGKTPQDAMERKAHDVLKPPSKEGADVKRNMDVAIMNAMNVGIEYRTKTMEDFEKELLSIDEVARVVEPEHREDLGKMPKWIKVMLASAAVLIVIFGTLLATGVINFGGVSSGKFQMAQGKTYVPALVNQIHDQAKDIATKNQLLVNIMDSRFSDEIEKNMVLSQSLPSGSEVNQGTVIDLVVSAGRQQTEVPSLLGIDVEEAKNMLSEAGLKVETKEVDNNAVAGSVISQSIESMTLVDMGTIVVLEYSNGNLGNVDISMEVMMPNLVKKKYEDAQDALKELGIQIKREAQYSYDVKEGFVISQSEAEGAILHQGDVVTLVVSLGKQKVNVPYVAYKTETEAKGLLEGLGLNVSISHQYSEDVQEGNVISQSIVDGTQVDVGTPITLIVSMGRKEQQAAQANPTPEPQWSEWGDSLPSGVSQAGYHVEQKILYSYRDKSVTESSDSTLVNQGYTLEATTPVYSSYGAWSDWTETAQTGSDLVKVEKQTRYSYRDKVATQSYYWGDWSEWQNDPVEGSGTREVETQEIPATYKTQYHYSRFTEYSGGGGWNAPTPGWWGGHHCQYAQETDWVDSAYAYKETQYYADGTSFTLYSAPAGGTWYNEATRQAEKTPAYLQYRYRDQKTTTTESWGNWTGYSENAVNSSDTREVRTKDFYRSASRTLSYTYTYSKWGGWTEYSENVVSGSGTREVRTKTQYRYKKK